MQVSKVLVVDGDRALRDALVTGLRFVGLEAHGAAGAAAARCWLDTDEADVVVMADPLPDGTPGDLLGLQEQGTRVVMMAASHGRVSNYRVDATLLRPISVSRVVEQVETLLRARGARPDSPRCQFGLLSLDCAGARVSRGEASVPLGRIETRLLRFFMGSPDRVFSRLQLLEKLWPANVCVEPRTVDVHIRRVRLALEVLGCAGYVQTVRGSGYRFSALPQ
jgi:two-component system phosphate regulon response regulator PhoB